MLNFIAAFKNKPVIFVLLMAFIAGNAFAQTAGESEKLVKNLNLIKGPVVVTGLKNSRQTIKFNEKFVQGADWLNDLTITIKNLSDKPITYIHVDLDFPETINTGSIMAFPLFYGTMSPEPAKDKKLESIEPGGLLELKLDEKTLKRLRNFIETRQPLDNVMELGIRINLILFDDDTGWNGSIVRRDPNNPRRFVPIEQDK